MKQVPFSILDHVNLGASVADLKTDHYRTLLSLSAVIDLLVSKGLLTQDELATTIRQLDQEHEPRLSPPDFIP
ncbi:hypothetical protein EBB07_05505 [Paenibacillaceae bacterium]|nr:hypothetical protein EBB07_05505 [Paenibacillaceae bacterium]